MKLVVTTRTTERARRGRVFIGQHAAPLVHALHHDPLHDPLDDL